MKRFKQFIREEYTDHKDNNHREIEFMCHNNKVKGSTPLGKLKALKKDLKDNHHSVITLHQNWSEGDERQHSLTAIYHKDHPEHREKILDAAKKHGVEVDLERNVSNEYAERAINGKHDNQVR